MANQISRYKSWFFLTIVLVGALLLASCKASEQQVDGLTFTVIFQDYDGTVLDTQKTVPGQPAVTPSAPSRNGYVFVGWDKDYRKVTEDMTITAQYTQTQKPAVMVVSVKATPGQSVKVPVAIVNNPGVAGAKFTMVYDPALTLKDSEAGEVLSELDHTPPGQYRSPCNFTWDSENGTAEGNGHILWLTFLVPSDASVGKAYAVNCVCRTGDMYDENLNDVVFQTINGTITIE